MLCTQPLPISPLSPGLLQKASSNSDSDSGSQSEKKEVNSESEDDKPRPAVSGSESQSGSKSDSDSDPPPKKGPQSRKKGQDSGVLRGDPGIFNYIIGPDCN